MVCWSPSLLYRTDWQVLLFSSSALCLPSGRGHTKEAGHLSNYLFPPVVPTPHLCCSLLQIKPENLRWAVGCVVSASESPSSPTLRKLQDNGYRLVTLPTADRAIQTTFPWRNIISIYISISRVWTALVKYQNVRDNITLYNQKQSRHCLTSQTIKALLAF